MVTSFQFLNYLINMYQIFVGNYKYVQDMFTSGWFM